MRPRVIVATLAAAVLGGVLLFGSAAQAVPIGNTNPNAQSVYDVLYDLQDVQTNADGVHRLRYEAGRNYPYCLRPPDTPENSAFVTTVVPARNLTDPSNAPIGVQAVEHTRCGVTLRFFNEQNEPVANSVLRITYTAASQRIAPPAPN